MIYIKSLDITRNINIIENLKSEVLYKVADIYRCMDENSARNEKAAEVADLIILLYLLAEKMGYSYETIDKKIIVRLKDGIKTEKDENSEWRDELKLLLRHFDTPKGQ